MRVPPAAVLAASLAASLAGSLAGQDSVDYATQIQPILKARCYDCHGAEEQEADLRLDRRDGVFVEDESLWVIQPGKPETSSMIERIELPADDPDIMPADGDPLTEDEIALIRRWIAEGASWPADAAAEAEVKPPEPLLAEPPTAAQLETIEATLTRLRARGGVGGAVAQGDAGIDVNLSLLRPAATDAELDLLDGLEPALVWLNLARSEVSDDGLAKVARFTNLRRLHLAQTGIGDAGVAHLRELSELRFLNLFGTEVTDAGLSHLHGLAKLEKVFLWQTEVTDAGVAALQQALPALRIDRGGYASQLLAVSAAIAAEEARKQAEMGDLCNTTCPVSGKDVDKAVFVVHEGRKVGFCCTVCQGKFEKEPGKFTPNLPPVK